MTEDLQIWCYCMRRVSKAFVLLYGYLLAGELAQHRRDVAGILSHLLLDGLLHSWGDAA